MPRFSTGTFWISSRRAGIPATGVYVPPTPSALLLEDGSSFLLLEDGSSHLLLESGN